MSIGKMEKLFLTGVVAFGAIAGGPAIVDAKPVNNPKAVQMTQQEAGSDKLDKEELLSREIKQFNSKLTCELYDSMQQEILELNKNNDPRVRLDGDTITVMEPILLKGERFDTDNILLKKEMESSGNLKYLDHIELPAYRTIDPGSSVKVFTDKGSINYKELSHFYVKASILGLKPVHLIQIGKLERDGSTISRNNFTLSQYWKLGSKMNINYHTNIVNAATNAAIEDNGKEFKYNKLEDIMSQDSNSQDKEEETSPAEFVKNMSQKTIEMGSDGLDSRETQVVIKNLNTIAGNVAKAYSQ